jgi:hypothetical protein
MVVDSASSLRVVRERARLGVFSKIRAMCFFIVISVAYEKTDGRSVRDPDARRRVFPADPVTFGIPRRAVRSDTGEPSREGPAAT